MPINSRMDIRASSSNGVLSCAEKEQITDVYNSTNESQQHFEEGGKKPRIEESLITLIEVQKEKKPALGVGNLESGYLQGGRQE